MRPSDSLLDTIVAPATPFGRSALAVIRVSGTQTLRIQVREDGVQLDQIVLSPGKYLNAAPGGVSNDSTIVSKP